MSNTLMIHIGTPKTGTSALQKFLADNAQGLKKYGWCYPNLEKDWATLNGWNEEGFPKNGAWIKFSMIKKVEKDILWKVVLNYLKHYNVIISEEGLWSYPGLDFEEVMREIRSRYDNVKIICYLRRQDLYIESKWNQDVKASFFGGDVSGYYEIKKEEFDYKKRLDLLAELFGKENVVARVYEKGQFSGVRGDITSDFLEACGIGSDWKETILPGHVNERIDNDVLGLKHLFNKEFCDAADRFGVQPTGKVYRQYFLNLRLKEEDTKKGYISKEIRQEFIDRYARDNEYVAKTYLGRTDGKLFHDTNIDIPLYEPEFSEREQQIVKLFAGILAELEQKQSKLEADMESIGVKRKVPQGLSDLRRKMLFSASFGKLNFK